PERTTRLVTHGVFARTRNPIYLGDALILFALALGLGNWLNFLLLPLFVAFIGRFQIAPEERALERRFGNEFRAYCARVRRWV
ncbi:MAG TPA: isoprenylcysteine carboxylmethyltransferase family protein, partial [Pseudomonas sp.]